MVYILYEIFKFHYYCQILLSRNIVDKTLTKISLRIITDNVMTSLRDEIPVERTSGDRPELRRSRMGAAYLGAKPWAD